MAIIGKAYYPLNLSRQTLANKLKSIPVQIDIIDGILTAPSSLYRKNKIAKNTRLVVSYFDVPLGYQIEPFQDFPYGEVPMSKEDIPDTITSECHLLTNKKLPSSVQFRKVTQSIPGNATLKFAASYIARGYKGSLTLTTRVQHKIGEITETMELLDELKELVLTWTKIPIKETVLNPYVKTFLAQHSETINSLHA